MPPTICFKMCYKMLQYAPAAHTFVAKCVTKCYNMHLLLKICYQQIKVCLHKFIKTHDLYPARRCDIQYSGWL